MIRMIRKREKVNYLMYVLLMGLLCMPHSRPQGIQILEDNL
jgi:hypothetical protein